MLKLVKSLNNINDNKTAKINTILMEHFFFNEFDTKLILI